jgi:hypothetical protein
MMKNSSVGDVGDILVRIRMQIRILGSVLLINGSGMTKIYGSYGSGSGSRSETLVKSHKEVTKQKKSTFFLLFLLDEGRSRIRSWIRSLIPYL